MFAKNYDAIIISAIFLYFSKLLVLVVMIHGNCEADRIIIGRFNTHSNIF